MSEQPLPSDSAPDAPKKPRRVTAPRPRKSAKTAAAEKPAPAAAEEAPPEPKPAPAPRAARVAIPRDPRLDDISGHEGPPRAAEPAPRQGRVTSNVRDARSEENRNDEAPAARPERPERAERPERQERQAPARRELREIREEDDSISRTPWPEPETIQGGEGGSTSGKRKRRRKKKGGQGGGPGTFNSGSQAPAPYSEAPPTSGRQPQAPAAAQEGQAEAAPRPPAQQAPRIPVDADELAKKAWRIFLGEVGEEGLALIGDQEARELSRRSFRLAELFLEEQSRRVR